MLSRKKKRDERSSCDSCDSCSSPEHKQARADAIDMTSELSPSSSPNDATDAHEPSLKDIHMLLIEVQGTVKALLRTSNKLTEDVAELNNSVARNRKEIMNIREELTNQNKYVASLEKKLRKANETVKEHSEDIIDLQVSLDNLEQYSRKNSLEFCGIPDNINMSTDQAVCKIAQAVGVELEEDEIEISHRIKQKRGSKPILAKFISHKTKSKIYKARTQLRSVSIPSVFPGCFTLTTDDEPQPKIFINENLTPYRREMMKIAGEKRSSGKIVSFWSLDGKIFIKTSPSGNPRQMHSIEEIKEL